jgi:hypothetical protein
MERERRDEVAIIRVTLNAETAVRTMVEKLVSLDVSEKEIADAIEHLRHEAETKAIFELSKRLPRTGRESSPNRRYTIAGATSSSSSLS